MSKTSEIDKVFKRTPDDIKDISVGCDCGVCKPYQDKMKQQLFQLLDERLIGEDDGYLSSENIFRAKQRQTLRELFKGDSNG